MPNVIIEPVKMPALLNARDVAMLLKISMSKASKLMNGQIETVRMGKSVRCTELALTEFIERCTVKPDKVWPDDFK